ncbi:MAG: HEAT repeat domain-containing protein [Planctomycetes bacterium]|nr:HEAT repeat domain-containing protein [Planctomycetota bacterium]
MLTNGLYLLLSLLPPASAAAGPSAPVVAIAAQEPAPNPNPDKRPELETVLGKLDGHIKKEGKEDQDAVGVIDTLLQEFPKSGPKDRVAIVKQLSKCFEQRRMVPEGQAPNNKLFLAAAVALGQMGPESVEVLTTWIGAKNLKKDLAVQHRLILSLGKTKEKKGLKVLKDMLNNKENSLISASAEALGEYAGADLETRKDVFEALLKTVMEAKGFKDTNPDNTIARDKYDVIAAPIITSLGKLSKHEERDPEKWQNWWNKNKKADWDKDS